ncbi:hypothetical protein FACS1894208_08200 [Clostridia bacterium]|nr:hypothetical protein FACS1894208_08200 [Clostridia bacterium]
MAHEMMKCKGCGKHEMEQYLNHTANGSYCNDCYAKQPQEGRDVDYDSPENNARDIVLAFVNDTKTGKRNGLRVYNRGTKAVSTVAVPSDARYWNLNIHERRLDSKCCNLSDFPILAAGADGKPVTQNAGAWVVGEHPDGRLRLISASGAIKDVTQDIAAGFHAKFKIANAEVSPSGALSGKGIAFPRIGAPAYASAPDADVIAARLATEAARAVAELRVRTEFIPPTATDKFTIDGDRVTWLYFNPDGYDERGQYVELIFGATAILDAAKAEDFYDFLSSNARAYLHDNDGSEDFLQIDRRFREGKFAFIGCTGENKNALIAYAEKTKVNAFIADKFFTDASNGLVEWITRVGGPNGAGYETLFVRAECFLKVSAAVDSSQEYFGKVRDWVSRDKHTRKVTVSRSNGDFALVHERYYAGHFDAKGADDTARAILVEFAENFMRSGPQRCNPEVPEVPESIPVAADVIDSMKALNDELKAACNAYYNEDGSSLSDLEYDKKFDELRALEAETGIILPDSVTQDVGAAVEGKLPKVRHTKHHLSLDKTKDIEALSGLLSQHEQGKAGVLAWKLDGLTVVATYNDGVFQRAVTLGNGKIGEDVSHNAKFFQGMPRRIPYTGELHVRGEAVISYPTFERINAALPEGAEDYCNPRNLASGTVRRQEVSKDGSVEFIAFSLDAPEVKSTRYAADLNFLRSQGFTPVFYYVCSPANVGEHVNKFRDMVSGFTKPTDGLVLTIDNLAVQEELGATGHHPKWALAFKWADEKRKTILRAVEWSASRTGVLTPVAIFDPIALEGTTVKRASVHNLSMLRQLKLGIGDEISVYKANMIIPKIAENHTQSDSAQPPKECPVCGALTAVRNNGNSEFVVCLNGNCAAKNVGLLTHFVKREALNIDGISEKSIGELVSAGFISKPIDFYRVKNEPAIAELPGWGVASYNKLVYAVETSRTTTLAQVIYSLGIKNVGRSASDALARHFKTIHAFIAASAEQLSKVEGVGKLMIDGIVAYLTDKRDEVAKLVAELTIQPVGGPTTQAVGVAEGASGCLSGLTFCVTGAVTFPGKRAALQSYISDLGGRNASSVTKNVDYLITNTPNSGSSKNKAAQSMGCQVISEATFMRLVKERS